MADFKQLVVSLAPNDYSVPFPYARQAGDYYQMSHSGTRIEWRCQAEEDCTISEVGIRLDSLGHQGDPPKYRVGIQALVNGVASGSYLGYGDLDVKQKSAGYNLSGEWIWVTISPTILTRGQFIAIVMEYLSGTVNISNQLTILKSVSGAHNRVFPGVGTGSTPSMGINVPIFGLKSSTGVVYGMPTKNNYNYLSARAITDPSEQAVAFNFAGSFGDQYKLGGIMWMGRAPNDDADVDYSVTLYDSDNNRLGQTVLSGKQHGSGSNPQWTGNTYLILFDERELPALYFNKTYRIGIKPNDETISTLSWDYLQVDGSDIADAWPGGNYIWYSWRADTGLDAWVDDTGARPVVEFIINEWGAPLEGLTGAHLKFTPKFNDNYFVQHADDEINDTPELAEGSLPHESYGIPIGDCIESYSGYLTVEVFVDPDTNRSDSYLLVPEENIEDVKVIRLSPWEAGIYELVFRLRAKRDSSTYREIRRYLQVYA